jgi:hypothetical protein
MGISAPFIDREKSVAAAVVLGVKAKMFVERIKNTKRKTLPDP